jgi:signal transduction histidine kinase/CheY-like chemotaxis protein
VSREKNATVVATLPLPAAKDAGQVLVAVSPFPDYARDLSRMSLLALLVMTVAVVLGVLIVRRFVRSIVDPIDRLREASARMAAGELDVATLGYIGTGEVAALARAFDRMAERVRSDEGELRAAYRRLIATQADLLQAEKLSTVGRLVSGVAHELNNPLTAILQLTDEVAGMPGLQPEDRELLGVVHQQAQRARNIVRDLLAAVRAREVRRERVTVATLVDAVTRGLRPMLEARRVRLVTEVMAGVPDLDADRSGLEQVLVNLIQNAIQATSAGGAVTLAITAPETSVMFVVEDDGPGISPDVLPRVFEPFFTTKEAGEGTGLGLFVTLGIVEAHGGTIRAENRPAAAGTGARFTVTLPAALPGERPAERSGGPDAPAPIPNDGRVLIVEDEPSIRHAVRRWFQRAGWTVDEVVNGDDALARCLAAGPGEYRVIVTDLKMPGMTGVELVDRLAVVRPDLYARMVIMTGDVASPDAAALIARTDRPVVEKPFTFEALAEAVGRVAGNAVRSEGR